MSEQNPQRTAQSESYVKNAYCDLQIPFGDEGKDRHCKPDFLVRRPLPNGGVDAHPLEVFY